MSFPRITFCLIGAGFQGALQPPPEKAEFRRCRLNLPTFAHVETEAAMSRIRGHCTILCVRERFETRTEDLRGRADGELIRLSREARAARASRYTCCVDSEIIRRTHTAASTHPETLRQQSRRGFPQFLRWTLQSTKERWPREGNSHGLPPRRW